MAFQWDLFKESKPSRDVNKINLTQMDLRVRKEENEKHINP